MMTVSPLDNLVRIGQLKAEPSARAEIDGLIHSGLVRLKDAQNSALALEAAQWRILDQAHRKRNLAEYEGDLDVDEALVGALIRVAQGVAERVAALGPVVQG